MNIAFVNGKEVRVAIVDMGPEADTVTNMSTAACNFINLICDKLGWHWEPVKQPRANSRIISFKELKDAINS